MKKNLRYLFAAVLMMICSSMSAGTIVFGDLNLENGVQYSEPFDGGDFTVTFAGGGNNGKYYTTGSAIRIYGDGTMTISAKQGKLTKIVLTLHTGDNKVDTPTAQNVNVGTYDPENSTWTGDAAEVVFTRPTGSGHWRIQAVEATISGGGQTQTTAAKPTINPNGGTFEESQEVTISHSNAAAKIYYALDEGEFQLYSAPFTLTKTTTVKAYAIDESCDVTQSATVSATFTKKEASEVVVATCAEIISGTDGTIYQVRGTCTEIRRADYGNWILKDETGEILIYGTLDAQGQTKNFGSLGITVGDIVTVQGPRKTYNETIELVDVTVINIEKGTEPTIEEITVAKAIEIASALEPTKTTKEEYIVKGYIVGVPDFQRKADDNSLYGNVNFNMADEKGGTPTLTVYRAKNYDNVNFTEETINTLKEGDKVAVRGKLKNFVTDDSSIYRIENCYLVKDSTSTAISTVQTAVNEGVVYNLQGQQVMQPVKGLYIINGKKVVIK